jgi:hypothetical protein
LSVLRDCLFNIFRVILHDRVSLLHHREVNIFNIEMLSVVCDNMFNSVCIAIRLRGGRSGF